MDTRLDHVRSRTPASREDGARGFFGPVLELNKIAKAAERAERGGCRLARGNRALRPVRTAYVASATDNLDRLRSRLTGAGRPIVEHVAVGGQHRFFAEDAFANRLELLDVMA